MNKKFFSGDSVRQALLQAARHFQVEPEQVAYREVDRRHGFLRGRRRAVIEVDLDQPLHAEGPAGEAPAPAPAAAPGDEPGPAADRGEPPARVRDDAPTEELPVDDLERMAVVGPRPGAEPRPESGPPPAPEPAPDLTAAPPEAAPATPESDPGVDSSPPAAARPAPAAGEAKRQEEDGAASGEVAADLAEGVQRALARIFELGRLNLEVVTVRQGEERLRIELRGEDEELLLEDRGRLLLAIQHLLPRMLRGLIGRSMPCLVDCDDFHEIRTEQLRDLAQRVASEVRNHRRSRTLEPMSPDERRIVHLTLADDPAVETVSQGNGLFKRVQIRPQKMQPRGFDPFGRE